MSYDVAWNRTRLNWFPPLGARTVDCRGDPANARCSQGGDEWTPRTSRGNFVRALHRDARVAGNMWLTVTRIARSVV